MFGVTDSGRTTLGEVVHQHRGKCELHTFSAFKLVKHIVLHVCPWIVHNEISECLIRCATMGLEKSIRLGSYSITE